MFFFFLDPKTMPVFGPEMEKFERVLDVAREVDPRMAVGTLAAFVYIARRLAPMAEGSENLRKIAKEMDIPYPSFLRHTDVLAEGISKMEGLGMLEKGPHPDDRRARQVRLTEKGLETLRKIECILQNS